MFLLLFFVFWGFLGWFVCLVWFFRVFLVFFKVHSHVSYLSHCIAVHFQYKPVDGWSWFPKNGHCMFGNTRELRVCVGEGSVLCPSVEIHCFGACGKPRELQQPLQTEAELLQGGNSPEALMGPVPSNGP